MIDINETRSINNGNPIIINLNERSSSKKNSPTKSVKPYEGPIFEANRYLKKVTVTFKGLVKDKLWQ